MHDTRKKVAILGGGMSALTTALELTHDPTHDFDITVYQLGWRLGGKGASGRNRSKADRIEEHGLHLWFGFYDNAFNLIQKVYKENARPLTKPLATWEEAFKPYNFLVLEELIRGKWEHWPLLVPENNEVPGTMPREPEVREFFGPVLERLLAFILANTEVLLSCPNPDPHPLRRALAFLASLEEWKVEHHEPLIDLLREFLAWLWSCVESAIDDNTLLRRLWIMADLAVSNIIGIIVDEVWLKGYNVINPWDYKDWIAKHGATKITVESAVVRAMYSLAFSTPTTFEAGDVLHGALLMFFGYKGALYYRMQAGMGDTIFGPLYEVLQKRGVKFKFFHKVLNLGLNESQDAVERIRIGQQVHLKEESYEPLFDVKGLPCWPSEPLYEQIVEGEELKRDGIDLESRWAPWKNVEEFDLVLGKDFDLVVLGIPLGALPDVCGEIIATQRPWQDMLAHMRTIPTQAFQVWQKPSLAGLAWPYEKWDPPILGAYTEPMDTYADMSELIIRESWPSREFPGNIAYFCGPLQHVQPLPPPSDHSFPAKQLALVKKNALQFLLNDSHHLWPALSEPGGPYDWDLLVDVANSKGVKRFDQQYFNAACDPMNWYTLSVTDSYKYRLKAGETGLNNLTLAGDWVDNSLNFACIEACVLVGKDAAKAVKGEANLMPNYIQYPGNVCLPQPFVLQGTKLYGFFLASEQVVLQRQLDLWFNGPSGGRCRFVPLLPYVMVCFVKYRSASSGTSPVNTWGFSTEQELLLSYFVASIKKKGNREVVDDIFWFVPQLFVDNVFALVGGREDYGFPKTLGSLTIPDDPWKAGTFYAETQGLTRYAPQTQALQQPIMKILRRNNSGGNGEIAQAWKSFTQAAKSIGETLVGKGDIVLPDLHLIVRLAEDLLQRTVPMLFLKQFRDIAQPNKACYQAICQAPAKVTGFHGGGLYLAPYDVELYPCDSFPLSEVYGVKNGQKSDLSFWLDFDFTIESGSELLKI